MSNSADVSLSIKLKDPGDAYQITILDGTFRTVASATGEMTVNLPPGIYKIQASVTRQTWESLVLLEPGSPPKEVEVPALSINSPVPLANTAQHHEYHEAAAFRESHEVHFQAGSGSAIFAFARRFAGGDPGASGPVVHPFTGLALHDAYGNRVADLQVISAASLQPGSDPWAACNILVDPGYYRLRMTLPSGDQVDQHIYACRGWQLQVFALQSAFGPQPEDVRANLVDASLFYRKFDPHDPIGSIGFDQRDSIERESYRLTELARQGLLEKQAVLKNEIRGMLWMKFDNPFLGILGAHLLLMDPAPDLNMLNQVVGNLRGMLGDHPDVEALALQIEPQTAYAFNTLPMLRKSWKLVLKASIKQPEIVPIISEASELSNHLWGEGMWLFSTVKSPEVAVNASAVVQSFTIKQPKQYGFTSYESAAVSVLGMGAGQPQAIHPPAKVPVTQSTPPLDDATAEMMVDTLGVPRGNVELLLQRANDKANLYESIRTELQPGFQRTRVMTKVLSEIKNAALSDKEDASKAAAQLIEENTDGSRIAAIGILQIDPDPDSFSFLLDAIGHSRSAFEQYQALSAARSYLPVLTGEQKSKLKQVIESQRGDGPDQYIKSGSDRWVLSDMILRQLN